MEMKPKKAMVAVISTLLPLSATAIEYDNSSFWSDTQIIESQQSGILSNNLNRYRNLNADLAGLKERLKAAPQRGEGGEGITIDLPLPNNKFARFRLFQDSIMEPELAAKFPDIKTYWGYDESNPQNRGRFDFTERGFHGMFSYNGERIFIDPSNQSGSDTYINYRRKDAKRHTPFEDTVVFSAGQQNKLQNEVVALAPPNQPDGLLRSYRLAVATTGEYTRYHGGSVSGGLSAVTTAINRVNEVYEVDFSVRLNLVGNNDQLIYTNPSSDPYTNGNSDLNSNTGNINSVIGSSNYDIGHIFQTSGGGVAGLGVVCSSSKGRGLTGRSQPEGDPFYIDYVAHEIGHQFNALHTFNGTSRSCGGGNRSGSAAYEPGSGATIMAYAGICDDENLQRNSDPYFHTYSISQVNDFITSGRGANCATVTDLNNTPPTAEAGDNYTIPARTPFTLTGSASDPDAGDNALLTFVWEQFDLGSSSSSPSTMVDNGDRPIFRSFTPTQDPSRTFPQLSDLLAGTSTLGVSLPTTTRELNFRLTVRDTRGGVSIDDMLVDVVDTGNVFAVTQPARGDSLPVSQPQSIRWNVAGTNDSPINCSQVDIEFSNDDGATFNSLVNEVANNGAASITLPNIETSTARLKLSCSDNVFFAISDRFSTGGDTPPPPPSECINLENVDPFSNTNTGSFQANDCTIELTGNIWRATQESFTITSDTVLTFDFSANNSGEIHGIGLTQSNSPSSNRTFKLSGSQNYGIQDYSYTGNGEVQSFSIPVGVRFTGENFRLILINDKDSGTEDNLTTISNVKLTN